MKVDVTIIGGGLAGLSCAKTLQAQGLSCLVLEQAAAVGGRVQTDEVDGFLLDRGFQVLLTAYPTAQKLFDYKALNLCAFYSGAWVHVGQKFEKIGDPKRHREDFWQTAFANVGRISDKFKVLRMRNALSKQSIEEIFAQPEMPTLEALRQRWGFSDSMIEMFYRPFLAGIMLDHSLRSSSRMMSFVTKMFAEGTAAVPAQGMKALPLHLAAGLTEGSVRLEQKVMGISDRQVSLASGETIQSEEVVVATDAFTASQFVPNLKAPKFRLVHTLYFAADRDPLGRPVLALEGDPKGPVNHVVSMSAVSPSYAPQGKTLISASVLDHRTEKPEALLSAVRKHLRMWFGEEVDTWRHLKTYSIPQALPDQRSLPFTPQGFKEWAGGYVCGDYLMHGSIEGALRSGIQTAEAILRKRVG